jgi:hypothetical protein
MERRFGHGLGHGLQSPRGGPKNVTHLGLWTLDSGSDVRVQNSKHYFGLGLQSRVQSPTIQNIFWTLGLGRRNEVQVRVQKLTELPIRLAGLSAGDEARAQNFKFKLPVHNVHWHRDVRTGTAVPPAWVPPGGGAPCVEFKTSKFLNSHFKILQLYASI